MTVREWLQNGDPAVARLARTQLLDSGKEAYVEEGWIGAFLSRFNSQTGLWGNGVYSPKWISTFYTLRDLLSLEVDPQNPAFQQGLDTLVTHMWNPGKYTEKDVCVLAMLLDMMVWAKRPAEIVDQMAADLMSKQLPDGGWNCSCKNRSTLKSSIHTTMSVVEALTAYDPGGYGRQAEGREYLLRKRLFRRETDGSEIFSGISQFHFPTRWKYDVLRGLVHFAGIGHPLDARMEEALALLKDKISKGTLGKGTTYSGLLHFPMETSRYGRMNTLRGLKVLKTYDPPMFRILLDKEVQS